MRRAMHAVIAIAIGTGAVAAEAQSLRLKEVFSNDRQKVAELSRDANAACGTSIDFSIDYSTYSKVLDDDNNQNPWAYLANVTDALKSICRSDDGKASVASGIRRVIVSNGSSETESLEGGVFRYSVPYAGHSPQSVVSWLKSEL